MHGNFLDLLAICPEVFAPNESPKEFEFKDVPGVGNCLRVKNPSLLRQVQAWLKVPTPRVDFFDDYAVYDDFTARSGNGSRISRSVSMEDVLSEVGKIEDPMQGGWMQDFMQNQDASSGGTPSSGGRGSLCCSGAASRGDKFYNGWML